MRIMKGHPKSIFTGKGEGTNQNCISIVLMMLCFYENMHKMGGVLNIWLTYAVLMHILYGWPLVSCISIKPSLL